jgi:hypothetical protein
MLSFHTKLPGIGVLRFIAGLSMLAGFIWFFASGYSFPGVFGEVLRHNQSYNIDASPLFYSEVEHMSALEEGARVMIDKLQRKSAEQEN